MGNDPFQGGFANTITETVSSYRDAELQAEIDQVSAEVSAKTVVGIKQVGICQGSGIEGSSGFIIAKRQEINGEFDTVCIQPLPDDADTVQVTLGRTTDQLQKRAVLTKTLAVTEDSAAAHHLEQEFPHHLDYNTQYGLIRLKVFDVGGNLIAVFPVTNPWNGSQYTYLDTWTTGNALNAPGGPDCTNDIIDNVLYVDQDGSHARVTFRVWADPTHILTFADQIALRAIVYLSPVIGGVVSTKMHHCPAIITDQTQVSITFAVELPVGQVYEWTKNSLAHGTGRSFSVSSTCQFTAGNVNVSQTVLNTMAAATTISFASRDEKFSKSTVAFTQPNPVFIIKKLQWLASFDGGATYESAGSERLAADQQYLTVGAQTATLEIKTKTAVAAIWKVRFFVKPGLQADSPTFSYTGPYEDIAAPTLATNADVGTTGPTVHEKLSVIKYHCVIPSANIATLDNYQVILSSQNTAPAGDPAVGAAGVLAITYGQSGTFDIALTASLTQDFYIYFRAHNKFNGGAYSVWSAGTNQHGYSNPVQAVIGSGVPVWSQRLIRSNTGAAVTNTTTRFYLDAGATSTTDFYKGSGTGPTALQNEIYISSLGAADKVRQITASGQDGTGIFVDVSPAWSGAPAGSLAFEIHGGLVIGGKSGTGHGTTSFILDHAADGNVSTTSHDYDGMTLYIPGVTAGQEGQKITNSIYNGGTQLMTLTIEPAAGFVALGGAPTNNAGYMICAGGFGHTASDETGTIQPVPFRTWLDTSTSVKLVRVETLLPNGENAFDLAAVQFQVIKKSVGTLRYDDKIAPATTTAYSYEAFSASDGTIRCRVRNLNRDTAAKGWSDWSAYGMGNASGDTPTAYTPGTFVPVDIDYFDPGNYPSSRYVNYG